MSTLLAIQEFLQNNFVRTGFAIVIFIYLIARISKSKYAIALQIVRYIFLFHLSLVWIIAVVNFYDNKSVFNIERATGYYSGMYWFILFGSMVLPMVLLIPKLGKKAWILFVVSLMSSFGFWMERLIIVISSLHRDFLPQGNTVNINFFMLTPMIFIIQSLLFAGIFVLINKWIKNIKQKRLLNRPVL